MPQTRNQGARIIVTGGTFDKQYDAIKGELTFKQTHLPAILEQARVALPVAIEIDELIDSLHMTGEHRLRVLEASREKGGGEVGWSSSAQHRRDRPNSRRLSAPPGSTRRSC